MNKNNLLETSKTLSKLNDLWIEFNISDLKPNILLINRKKIEIIKDIFPNMVLNNRTFIYGGNSLEICYTELDILGLSYSYCTDLHENT